MAHTTVPDQMDAQRAEVAASIGLLQDKALLSAQALQQFFANLPSFYDELPDTPDKFNVSDSYVADVRSAAQDQPELSTSSLPNYNLIVRTGLPQLNAIVVPSLENIPAFTQVMPTLDLPARPDATLPGAPIGEPIFNEPAIPNKPVFTLPTPPSIQAVAIPEVPALTLPVFDMEMDFGSVVTPTERFQFNETEYTSAMLDEVKAKLLNDLINGGYGIDEDDEQRMWDRARERELKTADGRIKDLYRLTASRGFDLPPGSFYTQLDDVGQEMQENNSTLSRDIAIKRADLFVENRRFTISMAREVENMLITYSGAIAERALNASRTQVEMGAVLFNTHLQRQNLRLDQYRTYAQVYADRVRAAVTALEGFRVQVEAAKLTVETQKVYADIYETQLRGVNALVEIYNTEMKVTQVQVEIETLKLEAFRSKVLTYAEQVRAKVAEFSLYETSIRGETAKMEQHKIAADAYTATVNGFEAKTRNQALRVNTELAVNGQLLEAFRSDTLRYRTDIIRTNSETQAILDTFSSNVRAYGTTVDAVKKASDASVTVDEVNARLSLAHYQGLLERFKTQSAITIDLLGLSINTQSKAADIHTDLATSYANGILSATTAIETA